MVVRLSRLDHMLELAGEVIIVSSNLNAVSRSLKEGAPVSRDMAENIKDLAITSSRISSDLHNLVTDVRTVDMSDLFARFRRLARDTSRRLGKTIRFEVEGEAVNIDKKTSERIYDPIAHQVRNAIDHGIETPAVRQAAGKDPEGRVTVRVTNRENNTVIEVVDDGAGIDADRIRRKIVDLGLTDAETASRLSQADVFEYLYMPGFSTADQASVTRGRGVGMDVIRTAMNEIGGETQIETAAGKGTRFSFILPKITAVNISDALLVRAGATHFAFPVNAVVASRAVPVAEISTVRGRSRQIQHLGRLLPLFDLLEVLGEPPLPVSEADVPVMIVEHKHRLAAFIVSDFLNPQKIVISEFDGIEVPGLTGTAVLSGRQLAMVIDLPRLFELTFGFEGEAETRRTPIAAAKVAIPLPQPAPEAAGGASAEPGNLSASAAAQPQEPEAQTPDSEFLHEVSTMLSRLNKQLLELEEQRKAELADGVFRLAHSIKGNLTMYGAEQAASLTHKMETLLERARHGQLALDDAVFDALFDTAAYLEDSVRAFLDGQSAPRPSQRLVDLLAGYDRPEAAAADEESAEDIETAPVRLDPTGQFYLSSRRRDGAKLTRCRIDFEPGDQPAYLVAYLILRRIQDVADVLGSMPAMSEIEAGRCDGRMTVLLAPRSDDDDLLDRLAENLKRYFGVLRFDAGAYA